MLKLLWADGIAANLGVCGCCFYISFLKKSCPIIVNAFSAAVIDYSL
jgi:hypothetical protein